MCLVYKSTTDALPCAERAPGQASFFLATCRKRERWTPEWFAHAWYELGPGRYLLFWELFGVNLCSLFGVKLGHAGAGGVVGRDSGYCVNTLPAA